MKQELDTYNNNVKVAEIQLDKTIQNFLERRGYEYYDIKKQKIDIETNEDISFVKISHISYDRNRSDTDLNLVDFQQLLSSVSSKSQKFIYMIEGSKNGINLYLGTKKQDKNFLKDTFNGIYSGSSVLADKENESNFSKNMKYSKAMLGIPALKRDSNKEYKQSLEKILFPMQGKKFHITLVAESYDLNTIQNIISNYQTLGSELHRFVKQSKNEQQSNANSQGITLTKGSSFSNTTGSSETNSNSYGASDKTNESKIGTTLVTAMSAGIGFLVAGPAGAAGGAAIGGMVGGNFFSKTENENYSNSYTTNTSRTNSINESESKNQNTTKTDTIGITFDEINKSAEYCENLIDTYIERFQKGLNHGMWNSSLYIQAEDETILSELEHTLKSVYSGDTSYYETIRFSTYLKNNSNINISKFPMLYFDKNVKHPIHSSFTGFSSAINTEELSILAALPNNDVDGIGVSKISSFGLTQSKNVDNDKAIDIGAVLNKKKPTHQRFLLSTEALNSHLFVSGITGSGKSNTIKSILMKTWQKQKIPFLVIEPAKSEYKFLKRNIPELQIFQLGHANDIFKFNPFIFDYKKDAKYNVLNHIDSIKSAFSAAFPMYGPMPYILEEAIQKIYEDKGWNLQTLEHLAYNINENLSDEFNRMLFPSMKDLLKSIENIVDNAGYHDELQNNIKAALITRIKNLTIGAKGFIFNSQHAISNEHLFEKPTVIELSSIVNSEEKSFIMGLILNALYRYRELKGESSSLKHLVVIEEAHRLLPNISLDQNMESVNSKASAVEIFTNMLAEVRSFGEGIIIADQVANKLHSDVIKNTNVKILHRTMAKDDRTVVGESINLNENQILDIAELGTGEAVVHSKEVHQAFLVKIDLLETDINRDISVQEFQKEFLKTNEYYKYEFPFESKFFDENGTKNLNENREFIISSKNQNLILQVITQALLGEEKKTVHYWQRFISSLNEFSEEKSKNIYYAIAIFLKFELLNSSSIYKKPYYFRKMYEAVIDIFMALNNKSDIEKKIIRFQKSLLHNRIKNIYASMEFYSDDAVDFSLIISEQFNHNSTTKEEMNTLLFNASENKEDLSLAIKDITQKIFAKQSYELSYALLAMRYGKREKNINILLGELNND